ncbi:MAG: EAL domain-containing protein [Nitrospiria bacterium]
MFRIKDIPIKRKLLLVSMLTSTLALLLASISFFAYELVTYRQGMVQELSTLAEIIGNNSTAALSFNDQDAAQKTLETLDAEPFIMSSCIYSSEGRIFVQYRQDADHEGCPAQPQAEGHAFNENSLALSQAIFLDDQRIGSIYLQSNLQQMHDRMMRYIGIGIISFLFCSLAALLLASKLQGVISGPILHLTEIASLVSTKKNYTIRADQQNHDELGLLVTRFNEMLSQIQERDAALESARSQLEDRVKARTKALQQEILEKRQTETALRESEERYAIAIRGANDGLWDWNLKDNTIYFSPRWKEMLGFEDSNIGNDPEDWFERIHPLERDRVLAAIDGHRAGSIPHFEQEHRMLHKDGSYRWMLSRGLAVRDAAGYAYRMAGSQTDITARRLAEEQLQYDAFHNKLTGLPNRALFMDRLGRAVNRAKRRNDYFFAMLFLDLDRFKIVNDSLGHAIGDELLIAISRRLKIALRGQDTVAHLGGDEFTILLDDLDDVNDAIRLTQRLQDDLKSPFKLRDHEVFISASIGIVLSTHRYNKPEDLLRDADTAMYRAKALGPGHHQVFDSVMHKQALKVLKLEADLRGSIEREELYVLYQPIVSLATGTVTGFEALVRWKHPEQGKISPEDFIPIAEETGMITAIGEWVFTQACRQIKIWQGQFHTASPLTITVNLSAKQFLRTEMISKIEQIMKASGPQENTIGFEITETVIMDNPESAAAILQELKHLGIRLYMDDFGTGYSSLSHLHRFPIDVLKIDRSFVSRLGRIKKQRDIINAIVTLAHNQGMSVVAEGVETKEQYEILEGLGCELGQGYFFSPPIATEDIEDLMRKPPEWRIATSKNPIANLGAQKL